MTITIDDQIASVQREIKMRDRVYPRWVSAGRMTQQASDRERAAMAAVLETLNAVKANDAEHLTRINEPAKGTNASLGL